MVVISLTYMLEIAFCKRTNNFGSFCCCYVPHAQDSHLELISRGGKGMQISIQGQAGLGASFRLVMAMQTSPAQTTAKPQTQNSKNGLTV